MLNNVVLYSLGLVLSGAISGLAAQSGNPVLAPHAADLVALHGDQLVPFNSAKFVNAPYTVLYYSAGWCPDCRRFSPSLVDAYAHQTNGTPRFEVLLISQDKNAEGMLKYMQTERMQWPALAYEKVKRAEDLKKLYSGHGIPCLTVINAKGDVVLQSKSDQDANDVLKEMQEMLSSSKRLP
jgi:thiol-disulfide isomerase/thioredoxin